MQRAGSVLGGVAAPIRNRLRSVGRQVLAIAKTARRGADETARPRIYRRLMATTRAVLREADRMVRRIAQRGRTARPAVQRVLQRARTTLDHLRPLARRVLAQTRARVLGGDTHVPDKVLSLFEPHTEAIRKGKLIKSPSSASWSPFRKRRARSSVPTPSMRSARPITRSGPRRSTTTFGSLAARRTWRQPNWGFSSAANEALATARGVRRWSCPRRARNRRPVERTKPNAGFDGGCAGASGAKAASVCSNAGMTCSGVATTAPTGWPARWASA